jgi:transposase
MGTRRLFSREFKLAAVWLVKDRGVSVGQAAGDLDAHENVLRKWAREQVADPQQALPGKGVQKPEQAEIERAGTSCSVCQRPQSSRRGRHRDGRRQALLQPTAHAHCGTGPLRSVYQACRRARQRHHSPVL